MEDDRDDGLADDQGGFLGILDGFTHVCSEPWYSRGSCRALVAAIFWWATTRSGTIVGPEYTGVGLHTLRAQPVRTALGYREGGRPSGCGKTIKQYTSNYRRKNLFDLPFSLKEHHPYPIGTIPDQSRDIWPQKRTLNKLGEVTVWESCMDELNIYFIVLSLTGKTDNPEVFESFVLDALIVSTPGVRYIKHHFCR